MSLARCHQKVPTTVLAQVMLLMVVMLITPDRAGRAPPRGDLPTPGMASYGRDGGIRTRGLLLPKQAR